MSETTIPYTVKPLIKWLKANGFANPNTVIIVDEFRNASLIYKTLNHRCQLLQTSSTTREDKFSLPKRSTLFTTPLYTYTNLLGSFPHPTETDTNLQTMTANSDIKYLKELKDAVINILETNNLPASLLPEFFALTASRIYEKHSLTTPAPEDHYYKHKDIEMSLVLTIPQIVAYLKATTDVETILTMWELGLMPEHYDDYINIYQDVPKDWVKLLHKENIKDWTHS